MTEALHQNRHELLFDIRRSQRYHQRRRRFFEHWHLATNAMSVLFGSATILSIPSPTGSRAPAIALAAIVTVLATIDMLVGTSIKAWRHADLAKAFIGLEREMVLAGELSDADLAKFAAERLRIETDEPPILRVLDSICHNELTRAMGYDESEMVRIRWYQRLTAQFVDIRLHAITKPVA